MSQLSEADQWGFKRGSLVFPHPVAYSCGKIIRASQPQGRLDATLKTAEILCRYLATLALASLRSREGEELPENLEPYSGALSWGHFLSTVQVLAKFEQHPLAPYLSPFKKRKKGPGKADQALTRLLELRNRLGHDLATLSKARALTHLKNDRPELVLLEAISALEGVLGLPLFIIDNITVEKKLLYAQRLLLMGESQDPIPDRIALSAPLEIMTPYLAISHEVIPLPPMAVYVLIEKQYDFQLAFLDSVDSKNRLLLFKTLDSERYEDEENHAELSSLFAGAREEVDKLHLGDGSTLPQAWRRKRRVIEEAGRSAEGKIPWESFSSDTVAWYASRLPGKSGEQPKDRIVEELLHGRSRGLAFEELNQLSLLFGNSKLVGRTLLREMSDFRSFGIGKADWDERILDSKNIFETLKTGIDFFAKHLDLDREQARELSNRKGSPDYVAMREALVNQFVHQDYSDKSAAAQVELRPQRVTFFNTGYSLVSGERLAEGGKSQARNPLIARALRLIGFAELAGSGVRALQHAWREAKRRPPLLETDKKSNTFTLTLNWEEVPDAYDQFWKKKLGVSLDSSQATILTLPLVNFDAKSMKSHADGECPDLEVWSGKTIAVLLGPGGHIGSMCAPRRGAAQRGPQAGPSGTCPSFGWP